MDGHQQPKLPSSTNEHPNQAERVLLTLNELSQLTGISISTLRRRIKDGSIPFIQPGGARKRIVFPADVVERLTHSAVASESRATTGTAEAALGTQTEMAIRRVTEVI